MPFPNDEVTPPVTKMYLVMYLKDFAMIFPPVEEEIQHIVRDSKIAKYTVTAQFVEKIGHCGKCRERGNAGT